MILSLNTGMFTNGKYVVSYGTNQRATFTIINEQIPGMNTIGTINIVSVYLQKFDSNGKLLADLYKTPIIGLGDGVLNITTSDATQNGLKLSKDNLASCSITLVEG
jgi:hypothetical protein